MHEREKLVRDRISGRLNASSSRRVAFVICSGGGGRGKSRFYYEMLDDLRDFRAFRKLLFSSRSVSLIQLSKKGEEISIFVPCFVSSMNLASNSGFFSFT